MSSVIKWKQRDQVTITELHQTPRKRTLCYMDLMRITELHGEIQRKSTLCYMDLMRITELHGEIQRHNGLGLHLTYKILAAGSQRKICNGFFVSIP